MDEQQYNELQAEIRQLKERVAALENRAAASAASTARQQAGFKSPLPLDAKMLTKKRSFLPEGFSEEKLAGTWFNRLGILAIMLAMAFFLKWSFDNQLIGELGRIVIGIVIGLAFIGAGEYFQRKKYHIYGQGFTGGGIAILYFSIFAAFAFYHLLAQPTAFVLMILITLAASLLAVRYDSPAIGIIGIVGGFATPFVLNNGENNRIILFSYVAILNAGVLLIAYFKKWAAFNYLSFVFTYLSFFVGLRGSPVWYDFQNLDTVSFLFLTLYFIIYLGVSYTRNLRLNKTFLWADMSLILFNAVLYFIFSYELLNRHYGDMIGFWAVFLGMVYLLMGIYIYRRFSGTKNLSLTLLAVAAGFITIAAPLQFDGYWISIAWAIEAVIVFYLNLKIKPDKVPLAGFVIIVLTIISLFPYPFEISGEEIWIFLNKAAVAYLSTIIAMALIVWLYYRQKSGSERKLDRILLLVLQIALNLLIILFLTREINAYFEYRWRLDRYGQTFALRNSKDLIISLVWGLHAAVLVVLGFWRRLRGIRWFGLGFLGLVIFKVFLYDLSNLTTPYRILSFMGLGIILLAVSWLYHRYKGLIRGE